MQLNLKSQHRQRVGKKIYKTQQNIISDNTREAQNDYLFPNKVAIRLGFNRNERERVQQRGRHNKQMYNEHKPLFLGHRLSFQQGTSMMKTNHSIWDTIVPDC